MSNVGFKGFAKPSKIDAEKATAMTSNVSGDEFVLWTGGSYGRRRASGRSACLATVTEKMRPVPLTDYVKRCLRLADGAGYDTSISVGGLSLHQGAKPCVYLHLVKDAKGNFVAKKAIPTPDKAVYQAAYDRGGFKPGDVVIAAEQAPKRVSKASKPKALPAK